MNALAAFARLTPPAALADHRPLFESLCKAARGGRAAPMTEYPLDELKHEPSLWTLSTREQVVYATCTWATKVWARYGCPVFALDLDLALMLCATDTSKVDLSTIRHPFPAYVVQVPRGVMSYSDSWGRQQTPTHLLVTAGGRVEFRDPAPETHEILFSQQIGYPGALHCLNKVAPGQRYDMEIRDEDGISDFDDFVRMSRLTLGVPLYLATSAAVPRPASKKQRRRAAAADAVVLPRVFDVTSKVRLSSSMRSALALNSSTDRTAYAVQTRHIVRGHFKQQPHGPNGADRKTVWVEPYWRGPEDGPRLVARTYETGTGTGRVGGER